MEKKSVLSRKQITFDLDTKALQQHYPSSNWRKAYLDIKRVMKNNGFEWIQGSVYVSKKPMAYSTIYRLVGFMRRNYNWMNHCMRDCRVTEVGKTYNLTHLFNRNPIILLKPSLQNRTVMKTASMSGYEARIAERKAIDSSKAKPEAKTKVRTNKDRGER